MGRYVKISGELVPIADMGGESQSTNFVGTLADWEALTQEQKNAYDSVDLIDDFSDEITEELDALNDRVGVAENQISALSDGQYADLTSNLPSEITGHNNGGLRVKRSGNVVTIYLSLKDISGNNNPKSLTNILPDWANPVTTLNPLRAATTALMSDGSVAGITSVNLSGRSLGIYFGSTKYAIGFITYVV